MSALFEDERPRSSSTPSFVLGKMVPTNFCVPRGPRFGGAAGRGPPRHAKIDLFLCPHGPLRKYFRSVFSACTDLYENIFEALFPASEWLWQGRRSSSKLRMSAAPTRRSSSTLANSMNEGHEDDAEEGSKSESLEDEGTPVKIARKGPGSY